MPRISTGALGAQSLLKPARAEAILACVSEPLIPTMRRQGLRVAGRRRPASGLENALQVGAAHVAIGKGPRAPAVKKQWQDAIECGRVLQLVDYLGGHRHCVLLIG